MSHKRKASDTDSGLIQGRAKRALQVGSLTSAVGGSYAWHALKRLFQSADKKEQALLDVHLKNALRIVESSRELRGAFMKLIQMLSMRGDLLPSEVVDILSVVQSSVPPMDYDLIRTKSRQNSGPGHTSYSNTSSLRLLPPRRSVRSIGRGSKTAGMWSSRSSIPAWIRPLSKI